MKRKQQKNLKKELVINLVLTKTNATKLNVIIGLGFIKMTKEICEKTAVRNEELIKLKVGKVLADNVDKQVFEEVEKEICECGHSRSEHWGLLSDGSDKDSCKHMGEKGTLCPCEKFKAKEGKFMSLYEKPKNHSPQEAVNGEGRQVIQPEDKEPEALGFKTCISGSDNHVKEIFGKGLT